jgi:hypothetical protein
LYESGSVLDFSTTAIADVQSNFTAESRRE